jgi:hypothetical protein
MIIICRFWCHVPFGLRPSSRVKSDTDNTNFKNINETLCIRNRVGPRPSAKNMVKTSLGGAEMQSCCKPVGSITCPVTV